MITFVGANDGLIMPRGVINYYRVMAARYENRSDHDATADPSDRDDHHHDHASEGVQEFYRLFHAPGVMTVALAFSTTAASGRGRRTALTSMRSSTGSRRRCTNLSDWLGQHGGACLHLRVTHDPHTSAVPLSANRGV